MSQYTRAVTGGLKAVVLTTILLVAMAGQAVATSSGAVPPATIASLGDLVLISEVTNFFNNIQSLVLTVGQAVLAVYIAFQLMYVGVSSQTTESLIKIITAALAFVLLQSFDSVTTFLEDAGSTSVILPADVIEYADVAATMLVGSVI